MPPLFKRGDELGEGLSLNRWKVVRKVGEGQFAEVYECSDALRDNRRVGCPGQLFLKQCGERNTLRLFSLCSEVITRFRCAIVLNAPFLIRTVCTNFENLSQAQRASFLHVTFTIFLSHTYMRQGSKSKNSTSKEVSNNLSGPPHPLFTLFEQRLFSTAAQRDSLLA